MEGSGSIAAILCCESERSGLVRSEVTWGRAPQRKGRRQSGEAS